MIRKGWWLAAVVTVACNAKSWDFADEGGASPLPEAAEGQMASDVSESGPMTPDAPGDAVADATVESGRIGFLDDSGSFRCHEAFCYALGLHCLQSAGDQLSACVQCRTSADCPPDRSHCDPSSNRCVECIVPQDCPGGESCVEEARVCVPVCLSPQDCPPRAGRCDTVRKVCVECSSNLDCPGQLCDVATGRCGNCLVNSDCLRTPQLRFCDHTTLTCVECVTNADCRSGLCNYLGSCVDVGTFFDRDASGQSQGDASDAASSSSSTDGG